MKMISERILFIPGIMMLIVLFLLGCDTPEESAQAPNTDTHSAVVEIASEQQGLEKELEYLKIKHEEEMKELERQIEQLNSKVRALESDLALHEIARSPEEQPTIETLHWAIKAVIIFLIIIFSVFFLKLRLGK